MINQLQPTQDIDYLYASTRIRSLENQLLNAERLKRMAEAATDQEALNVLLECGYGEGLSLESLAEALAKKRRETFALVTKILPEPRLLAVFLLKYDYHNLKAMIKGYSLNQPYAHLLLDCGTIPVEILTKTSEDNLFADLPPLMREAARSAVEVLNRTQDPRLSDTVLDRAMYAEMLATAEASGVRFLLEYVRLAIDSANLRTTVRLKKMGQSFLRIGDFYTEGGTVSLNQLKMELTPEALETIYAPTPLAAAAQAAARALRGEAGLTELDIAADDALTAYLSGAKTVGFGVEPVLAYVAAYEQETAAIHTVLAGRRAGLSPEAILERLRKTYV